MKFECRRIHVKVDTGIASKGTNASKEILEEGLGEEQRERHNLSIGYYFKGSNYNKQINKYVHDHLDHL